MAADAFFETFRARVKLATEAEAAQREKELADLRFEAGEHWDTKVKKAREDAGKPVLTIDLLGGPIKQVTNQQRTSRPGIKISPVGKGADDEKAEWWQGVVRRVERLSQANRVYTWAGQHQVKMGRGFWVVRNVEVGDDGEQDIRLEEVENQHTVLCDPATKKLNGEDKRWAIRFEDLTHEEYIERFGESKLADALREHGFLSVTGTSVPGWLSAKYARIAEYYYVEETARTRLILGDGHAVYEDEAETPPAERDVKRRVKKTKKTVHWCLVNGMGEKLDSATIPGEFVPVVMIYGERRMIDGERDFRGMVRMNQDPSRMEDWAESSLMEGISNAKTSPWLAEEGQIEPYENDWKFSNIKPPVVLKYKAVSIDGHPIPPPTRIPSGVDVSALTLAAQRMQNHVRIGTGTELFQEETGSLQSRISGKAYDKRRQSQELTNSDYMENLGDGIVLTAKIIMSMAREIYDTPRLLRIIGADEKESEIVAFKGQEQQPDAMQLAQERARMQQKIAGMLDISVGEYDIAVKAIANSPQTAREEARLAMEALPPELLAKGADIYIGTLDFPGAQELAKRFKPPDAEDGPTPEQMMERLKQLDEYAQAATEQLNAVKDQLADKQAEIAAKVQISEQDNATKLQIEEMKIAAQLELARIKGQFDVQTAELEVEKLKVQAMLAAHTQAVDHAHEDGARADEQQHEARMGAQEMAHERAAAAEEAKRQPKANGAGA